MAGFALIASAAIMFFLALQYGGNAHEWSSSLVAGLFVGAASTLAVFLAWESHLGDHALVPFSIIKQRAVWSGSVILFFTLGAILSVTNYLPVYFQWVRDDSPFMSGVHVLPFMVAQIVSAVLTGHLGTPSIILGKCWSLLPGTPLQNRID